MKLKLQVMLFKFIILFFIFFANSIYAQDSLSYIVIRSASNGNGAKVGDFIITVGDTVTLYCASYDSLDNYISEVNATWTSTGTLDSVSSIGTSYVFAPIACKAYGRIIATYNGFSDTTGFITVFWCGLHHIIITTAPYGGGIEFGDSTIIANDSIAFYATGYDCSNNFLSDFIADWSSTGNLDMISYTGSNLIFKPITAQTSGRIIATYNKFSDTTGNITVLYCSRVHHIIIRDAPDGAGNELGSCNMTADESISLYCAAYDSLDNYISDVNANWSSTGSLDSINEIGTSFTFTPIKAPTSGVIMATFNVFSDETGTITVCPGALHHIKIIAKGIDIYSDITIYLNDHLIFCAAGYDVNKNYLGDFTINWGDIDVELTGTLKINFPTKGDTMTGSYYTTTPSDTGSGRIIFNETDTTGVITVIYDPLKINHDNKIIPTKFKLEQAYPNPFNTCTTIPFHLPQTSAVTITIYDLTGRIVKKLARNRSFTAGRYFVTWDGKNQKNETVGTGIYLYELKTEFERSVRQMILIK
jgi:hypothetical protein